MLPSFPVAFFLSHTSKQNETENTNPRNSSQTLLKGGNLNETTPQLEKKRENNKESKGEKNTISAPLCSTAERQSVKMRSLSASTLTSNQTLTLLKICKTGHEKKEKGKETYKPQKQDVLACVNTVQ